MTRVYRFSLLIFASACLGSSFNPECPLPPPGTTYVSGPNIRSTTGILWNCVSIMILCTWSIQHLNVPSIRPEKKGFIPSMWRTVQKTGIKIKWMVITILVPEYILSKSLGGWVATRDALDMLYGEPGLENPWETLHIRLANLGYFVLDMGETWPATAAAFDDNVWKYGSKSSQINKRRFQHRYWALDAHQWMRANRKGLTNLPDIPKQYLEGLDRSGGLVKALALIQVTYLVASLITRKVRGLPSTQLEISTLAIAVTSFITYILCWEVPQGVETIHIVPAQSVTQPQEIWSASLEDIGSNGPLYLWHGRRQYGSIDLSLGPLPIPNDGVNGIQHSEIQTITRFAPDDGAYGVEGSIFCLAAIFGGTLFGGLHCLAWNFEFPTEAERTAWRVCSALITALPVAAILPMIIWTKLNPWLGEPKHPRARKVLGPSIIILFIVPYVIARLFIIAEMIRSLFHLPQEAYVDTWAGAFPHWN
ncbi:hypothetical protein QBC47DRAFT_391990 [Echria macrotheca]|uniref:Uncharacterized protein n=1 Tax=Echria macrotheca TaxID=438768 RepID=A0AAJ0F7V6_9PEZI|nr:hypothetical protein QBC47DRAFT_391990 [Echria macrotheca]